MKQVNAGGGSHSSVLQQRLDRGYSGSKRRAYLDPHRNDSLAEQQNRKNLHVLQRIAEDDRKDSRVHSKFKAARNAAKDQIRRAKQDSSDRFISSVNPDSTSKDL